jgi:hypothetical protein
MTRVTYFIIETVRVKGGTFNYIGIAHINWDVQGQPGHMVTLLVTFTSYCSSLVKYVFISCFRMEVPLFGLERQKRSMYVPYTYISVLDLCLVGAH